MKKLNHNKKAVGGFSIQTTISLFLLFVIVAVVGTITWSNMNIPIRTEKATADLFVERFLGVKEGIGYRDPLTGRPYRYTIDKQKLLEWDEKKFNWGTKLAAKIDSNTKKGVYVNKFKFVRDFLIIESEYDEEKGIFPRGGYQYKVPVKVMDKDSSYDDVLNIIVLVKKDG